MTDPANPLYWPPEHVWKLIDHHLLNNKLAEIAEEMQLAISKDKGAAFGKQRKLGNSGAYYPERARLEGLHQDEWAEKQVQACIHVWETQGYQLCPGLYRAIYSNLIVALFSTRRGVFASGLAHEDQVMKQPGRSQAVASAFARETLKRCSHWNRKMDSLALECEHSWMRQAASGIPSASLPAIQPATAEPKASAESSTVQDIFSDSLAPQLNDSELSVAEDFRSIRWKGELHTLTRQQGQMFEVLYQAYKAGHPDVSKGRLLTAIENETSEVRSTWRKSPLWRKLIVHTRKGVYRLNPSGQASSPPNTADIPG